MEVLEKELLATKERQAQLERENARLKKQIENPQPATADQVSVEEAEADRRRRLAEWRERQKALVFTHEGKRYQFVVHALIVEGQRLTAEQMIQDKHLLAGLIETGSGAIELIDEL
jgi:hypothetical protein